MSYLKRLWRHLLFTPAQLRRSFPATVIQAIEDAVSAGEREHCGQVRFVVEGDLDFSALWADVSARQRAIELFSTLRVWDTEHNNGVLVYVLLADRKVEIIADRGIDRQVGAARWSAICKELEHHYRRAEFSAGSVAAVRKISEELKHWFPATSDNPDAQDDRPLLL